jgi:hypothetical protein
MNNIIVHLTLSNRFNHSREMSDWWDEISINFVPMKDDLILFEEDDKIVKIFKTNHFIVVQRRHWAVPMSSNIWCVIEPIDL